MSATRTMGLGWMVAAALTVGATPVAAQWQIESKDGKASLKIGFLVQGHVETLETADNSGTSSNLYLRRFRILFSGKVSDKWTYFFETDQPNAGKANAAGVKDAGSMYIQDAFVTYNHTDAVKVDVGMILPALSRNNIQAATTLLPVDYGAYSFVESSPLGTRVGRDYGVQLRGYPFKQKLEYRVGVFQGARGTDARNELRYYGRAVYYPFGAETGFFYAGTFQGKKRMVAIGASVDHQEQYNSYAVDAFVEQPINKGAQGVTGMVVWKQVDGGSFLTTLPEQRTLLCEAAFHAGHGRVSPFVQYSRRDFDNPVSADQDTLNGGVAWWLSGHNRSLKVSVGRQHTEGQKDRLQVLAQLQIFYF